MQWPNRCRQKGIHKSKSVDDAARRKRAPQQLYERDDKSMSKEGLLSAFEKSYSGPPDEAKPDFENGLKELERVKSIRTERGNVRLVELIAIRL